MLLARNREKTVGDLYAFSRGLTGIAILKELVETTAEQVSAMLRLAVFGHIEDAKNLCRAPAIPPVRNSIKPNWRLFVRLGGCVRN